MRGNCKVQEMWSVLEKNVHQSIQNNILGVAFAMQIAATVVSHIANFNSVTNMNVFANFALMALHPLNSATMLESENDAMCLLRFYITKYYIIF